MGDQAAMFDLEPVELAPPERLTAGERRRRRQAALLARKRHPLEPIAGPLKLHADAAPADDRDAPGLRCGGCQFRQLRNAGSARDYAKCLFPSPHSGRLWRDTHSEASDVRAWWPACTDYQQASS